MKIDTSLIPGTVATTETRPRPQAAAKKAGAAADVTISDLSTRLQEIEGNGDNTPSVDTAKISAIKQAIAEGRFTINTGAIADRLIGTAQEILEQDRRKSGS